MPDNAPFSVNRPSPYPNTVINFQRRVTVDVVTIIIASGTTSTLVTTLSSAGVSLPVQPAAGRFSIQLPVRPAGTVGWVQPCATLGVSGSSATDIGQQVSGNPLPNFATGVLEAQTFNTAGVVAQPATGTQLSFLVYTMSP